MRTLITGGAGFLGSHLCDRFLALGHEVLCVDNLITGSLANLEHLRNNPQFSFIRHDISHPLEIDGPVDHVLHFASPASPVDYLRHPIPTLKVGSLGTHNALGLAKLKNARFLLASTSEVYGDPEVHPQREEYWGHVNPIGVRGCFSADTEILTKEGWQPFPQLRDGVEVLTLAPGGTMEYQRPTEILKQRYLGELISFSNSKIDLLVTPNHKMLVRERGRQEFRLLEAYQDITWEKAEMLKAGQWVGEEKKDFPLPLVANTKVSQPESIPMELLRRPQSCSRRTALRSRPDGSGEPSYGSSFLTWVIGMAGSIHLQDSTRSTHSLRILTDRSRDFLTPVYPRRQVKWYDGSVYCVNVPNHIIYVRRNGKAAWCGNCYDEAKRFAEAITMAYHRYHKIDTHICRIFNTIGERMRLDDGRVLPNLMGQALRGEPLTVYGDGSQTRSFCYAGDLVEGICRLLATDFHEPVNLGNPNEVSILDFAKEILALTGSSSAIVFQPLPQDDPRVRRPDISRARRLLGWEPKTDRQEGLRRTLEYFRTRVAASPPTA